MTWIENETWQNNNYHDFFVFTQSNKYIVYLSRKRNTLGFYRWHRQSHIRPMPWFHCYYAITGQLLP